MSVTTSQRIRATAAEENEKLLSSHENTEAILPKLSITVDATTRTGRPPNWIGWDEGDPGCKRACSHCIFNFRPWVTWVSTLCIIGGIRTIVELYFISGITTIFFLGTVVVLVFCIVYIISVMCSETWKKVSSAMSRAQLADQLQMLQQGKPTITWHMRCYHHDESQADLAYSNGSACVEMTKKKIVTWSGSKTFDFRCWKDVTHPFQLAESGSYQIISMHKNYVFADEETRSAYDFQKQAFTDENRHQDLVYDIKETFELDGFEEDIVAEILACPCLESRIVYVIMTLLLLACPWAFLVKTGERRLDYYCAKVVSVRHEKIIIADVAVPQEKLVNIPDTELDD